MNLKRVAAIRDKLSSLDAHGFLVTSPYNIAYLSGITPSSVEEREFYIFITTKNTYVLAPQMFMLAVKEQTSGVHYRTITPDDNLYKQIAGICKDEHIVRIGFEQNSLFYREYERLQKLTNVDLEPYEGLVEDLRKIKEGDEITAIKQACTLTDQAYSSVLKKIKADVTEVEIAWEIEEYIRTHGGGLAFSTIVAFGENAAVPHHISTSYKLEANSFVLLDFGAKVDGYCADMSRTVFFGTPTDRQKKMYNAVKDAQELALEKLSEWNTDDFQPSHLHALAESHIREEGFPPFPHALGHGMGLAVHESPSLSPYTEDDELSSSMVLTVEPGVYLPGVGGVRIEDDVLLLDNGYEVLTKSSRELTVIT